MPYINWSSIEELYAGTTIKDIEKSQNNNMALHTTEDSEAVIQNRKDLMEELNFELERCVFANQTHSTNIHKVTREDIGAGAFSTKDEIKNCDALYTKEKNILLGVFTADCVPILIYDKGQNIVAAIHAGWKGTINELTKKMLDTLIYDEDSQPEELYAYIGPSIEFLNFEVSLEIAEKVKAMSFDTEVFVIPKENGKALIDLKGLNHHMLLSAGIPDTHIFIHHGDTYEDEEDFFSHRKRNEQGRMMTFILQK
ncbi:YfiH family protein [Breznakia sp. PF5-3]|uniref:peptidoglycan editing factor PgeF n=1 Tax=unclassified Breznakia TaxID=2623764 RepID=UPI002404E2F6|nr:MULTISPECIES: peptidoglycan editing factor PgeF [unclassified Breznakia]MDF9823655.1 YfiH family protein [Breznakia sp. PM6-1]MDF9834453.1 YfiH family protein [Breznakia sp. PF5-3]MDF9838610.1 YfiH family protein [Breznakia sp. PFB2-8]MDF9860653.1 YfiH family protein [Breznakia sp. PH5-24]